MFNGIKGMFYCVNEEDIPEVEKKLGCKFPFELSELYRLYGRGYLKSKYKNLNRIFGPSEILDYVTQSGEFKNYPGANTFVYNWTKLPFFERTPGAIFAIEINSKEQQKIFHGDVAIANSLEEFIAKYQSDEFYDIMILENRLIASGQLIINGSQEKKHDSKN